MSDHDPDVGRPPILPTRGVPPDAMAERAPTGIDRRLQPFGTIVIVGGGCYGSYYLRQLSRAGAAGAVAWERLVVVDRDPNCRVVAEHSQVANQWPRLPPHEVVVAEWKEFFRNYLDREAIAGTQADRDAIVPSPLMPHLMYDWLLDRAERRWPGRRVGRGRLDVAPDVPWSRAGEDGTQYVSFAEWMCPINCIEPARCPHTRGPRSWSMPTAVDAFVRDRTAAGHPLHGPCVFHCTHRAYGVGMIDTRDVLAADRLIDAAGTEGPADVLIGTASHCHGALGVLSIGPAAR